MNKRDIVIKLQADKRGLEFLLKSAYASDSKVRIEALNDYVGGLLEWIQQEGKV